MHIVFAKKCHILKVLKDDVDEEVDGRVEDDEGVRDVVDDQQPSRPVRQHLLRCNAFYGNCIEKLDRSTSTVNPDHLRTAITFLELVTVLVLQREAIYERRPLVYNGHYLGVPRVVFVHRFDCTLNFESPIVVCFDVHVFYT